MDSAAEALLIIVSATLSGFLIVGIIAVIYIIRIAKRVDRITEHAENVAESMESAAETFRRTATPIAFLKVVGNIVDSVTRSRKRRD